MKNTPTTRIKSSPTPSEIYRFTLTATGHENYKVHINVFQHGQRVAFGIGFTFDDALNNLKRSAPPHVATALRNPCDSALPLQDLRNQLTQPCARNPQPSRG